MLLDPPQKVLPEAKPSIITSKPRYRNNLLNYLRYLNDARHSPGLRLRNWTTFLNLDSVTGFRLVVLVMRVVLVRTHDDFAVQRMLDVTLDQHGNSLVILSETTLPISVHFSAFFTGSFIIWRPSNS
jgi:hypothetical protein